MKRLLALLCIIAWGTCLAADEPPAILLWPEGAPGAVGEEPRDIPEVRISSPEKDRRNGCCIVVLPGGGYGGLAADHEGKQIAAWLTEQGITAAVVKYRLGPRYRHPAPLDDASRAVRYVRAHADELGIDPHRVGIWGFSAGGHLASTVSTHYDAGDAQSADPVSRQSSRPDFAILCYPVISFQSPFLHSGSRKNLLGDDPDPELVKSLSNETQVDEQTPPTFLFHTSDDPVVPVENALAYYAALRRHHVPAEMHIYQSGPHGVGLAQKDPVLATWTERLSDWLHLNGWIKPASSN